MNNVFKAAMADMLCAVLFFTGCIVPVFAAAEKELSYEYYFEADSPDDLHYEVEEEIEVDGKHYRLKDISYDLYSEPITEKKKYKSKDKKADEYITQNIEGTEFKLYAPEKIKWKDHNVTYTQEYSTEDAVPDTLEYEGKVLSLRSMERVSRTDPVSTVAKFYSSTKDNDEYIFNGKTVTLSGGEPKWSGYKDDYADYLGVKNNNDYTITGSYWNGKAKKSGDGYVRYATVQGTKKVNFVTATFDLSDDPERYTATVTYTSKYIGHAKAVYEIYTTTRQKIIYAGIGIGILILLTTLILFLLRRRKDREDISNI